MLFHRKGVFLLNHPFPMKDFIKIHDKTFVPYLPYEEIMAAIDSVADKINAEYMDSDKELALICTLNGAVMFTSELMKRLDFPCELVSIKLSSYKGTDSTGDVKTLMGFTSNIKGKVAIIIEDIVDTGNTIVKLKKLIEEAGAAETKVCTMLLKPDKYKKDIKLDYVGKEIPNDFIVGFGLDYDELGRNLKDIYTLSK